MGCTSATNPVTFGETLSGFLPGMAGCGCGCAGEVSASIAGRMVGMDHHGFVVQPETGFQRNWRATGASSRVSAGGEVGSSENRHAQETADRTNAVLSSGDVALTTEWIEVQQTGDDELIDAWWFEHYHDLGLYYPCSALVPPDEVDWAVNACQGEIKGDSDTCKACDVTRTEADFTETVGAPFEADSFYKVTNAPGDPEAASLFAASWQLVLENMDLVRWARCWVKGRESGRTTSCITDNFQGKLHGKRSRLVRVAFNTDCEYNYQAWGFGLIQVCTEPGYGIDYALSNWTGATDVADQACAAIETATVLVHEMHHVCGTYNDKNRNCTHPDLVENIFQWAMLNRYSFARNSKSCRGYYDKGGIVDPKMFGRDE